jgi:hypothetical protein
MTTTSSHLWVLQGFEREPGNKLVESFELPDVTDDDVRTMFALSADDDLVGEFEMTMAATEELQRRIGRLFRAELEYFLGAVQSQ